MKAATRLFLLVIVLIAATVVSNPEPAWAMGCSATFWNLMAEDCGYDRAKCACESFGSVAGCTDGDTSYWVDCSGGGTCNCSVYYQ